MSNFKASDVPHNQVYPVGGAMSGNFGKISFVGGEAVFDDPVSIGVTEDGFINARGYEMGSEEVIPVFAGMNPIKVTKILESGTTLTDLWFFK